MAKKKGSEPDLANARDLLWYLKKDLGDMVAASELFGMTRVSERLRMMINKCGDIVDYINAADPNWEG